MFCICNVSHLSHLGQFQLRNDVVLRDTPVPLSGRAEGGVARRQHLDSRTGIFLLGVFGQPLLAALLRVF